MSEGRSTSIVIFRAYDFRMLNGSIVAQTIYSSMDSESDEQNKMVTDYWDAQTDSRTQTLRVTDKYQIQKMYIQRLSNEYVYLSASLDNGDNILIRSSIDSIERSVNLANQFFMYVSLLMLIVGTLVVYFISRNITQPILGLAQIATRMSELDFTTKYQVNRQDEIGILGNSMNYLSSTLETTLGGA